MLSIAKNRWLIFSREDAAVHYEHSQKVTGVGTFQSSGNDSRSDIGCIVSWEDLHIPSSRISMVE